MRGIGLATLGLLGANVLIDTKPTLPSYNPRRRYRQVAASYGGGRSKTTWHQQHGKRERERRMRQIAAGSLRIENGLVVADGNVPQV